MERTLIYGILLFIVLFILNTKLTTIANKGMPFKLGVFFAILTLLFLAVGGINDQFGTLSFVTCILTICCIFISIVQHMVKVFNGKVDVVLMFCLLTIIFCEGYVRLDPYGSFLYLIFKKSIDVQKIEIYAIIGFIIFLSTKIFAGIFLKKDLAFLNKKNFQVKDGKGK
ncbi:hypothetical protein [Intestinibacter bartlettii]|uniref:Uncharacterized protein n=1 Tax=Intestinibacter bartlettii TaxID=261299 RepID=A0ABS6DY29_9FIRM|nr:hypothetical protein [Intestinibacter bartlettii]MBU5336742.1 hypothetical protein [Intestinibacter bartlettii]